MTLTMLLSEQVPRPTEEVGAHWDGPDADQYDADVTRRRTWRRWRRRWVTDTDM